MYFNTATKYVATIDENKKDVKHVIETPTIANLFVVCISIQPLSM